MIQPKTITAILAAAMITGCNPGTGNSGNQPATFDTLGLGHMKIHMETQKCGNGYGYILSVNGHTLINQDLIPAIPGNYQFANPNEAFLIGREVARQMAESDNMPVVTKEMLAKHGIIRQDGTIHCAQ